MTCRNGIDEANKILIKNGKVELSKRFEDFNCAINVLKHGRGRSYDVLVAKSDVLSFRIKLPHENFFSEGDLSEILTLIEVDDNFVLNCAKLIEQITKEVRIEFTDYCF